MRLARSILFAKDVPRLTAFYRDMLQLEVHPSEYPPAEWTVLAAGGCELALHRVPDPWNARIEIASAPRPREDTPLKPKGSTATGPLSLAARSRSHR